jgi:surface antigen
METKKKVMIIVGGLLAVGTALYFIFRKDKENPVAFVRGLKSKLTGESTTDIETNTGGSAGLGGSAMAGVSSGGNLSQADQSSVNALASILPGLVTNPLSANMSGTMTALQAIKDGYKGCPSYKAESWPMAKGMRGGTVATLQMALNTVYKKKLTTDGCFGPLTETAVKSVMKTTKVDQANFKKIYMAYQAISMTT